MATPIKIPMLFFPELEKYQYENSCENTNDQNFQNNPKEKEQSLRFYNI